MRILDVSRYLSQLAVLEMIRDEIGSEEFKAVLNRILNLDISEEEAFQFEAERTGPALNVKIVGQSQRKIIFRRNKITDTTTYLDADFTLALSCPKFPRDGKCKHY